MMMAEIYTIDGGQKDVLFRRAITLKKFSFTLSAKFLIVFTNYLEEKQGNFQYFEIL